MRPYEQILPPAELDANYGGVTDDISLARHFQQGGREVSMSQLIEDGVMDYISVDPALAAKHWDGEHVKCHKFFLASCNREVVHAEEYTRPTKKESYHVAVDTQEGLFFGSIKYFVKVEFVDKTCVRLARVDFYKEQGPRKGDQHVVRLDQIMPRPVDKWCPLESVKGKVMFAKLSPGEEQKAMVLPTSKFSD